LSCEKPETEFTKACINSKNKQR